MYIHQHSQNQAYTQLDGMQSYNSIHSWTSKVSSTWPEKSVKSQRLKTCCIFTGKVRLWRSFPTLFIQWFYDSVATPVIWGPTRKAHKTGQVILSFGFVCDSRIKFFLESWFCTLDLSKEVPKRTSLQASKRSRFYMWQNKSMKDLKNTISIFN